MTKSVDFKVFSSLAAVAERAKLKKIEDKQRFNFGRGREQRKNFEIDTLFISQGLYSLESTLILLGKVKVRRNGTKQLLSQESEN